MCINDKDFPSELPLSKRPKQNEEYTIVKIEKLNACGGIIGVQLDEIDLSGCAPYLFFAANRFAPIKPDKELVAEEIENLYELA